VEDLREHYEETLHRWVDALSRYEYQAISLTDEKTFRTWKLYMTGSAEAFRRGDIAIHQMLLSRSEKGQSKSAKVREAWYRE
jgi:cyclopropane-fatty-acyl-phospholipid synthase